MKRHAPCRMLSCELSDMHSQLCGPVSKGHLAAWAHQGMKWQGSQVHQSPHRPRLLAQTPVHPVLVKPT